MRRSILQARRRQPGQLSGGQAGVDQLDHRLVVGDGWRRKMADPGSDHCEREDPNQPHKHRHPARWLLRLSEATAQHFRF